MPNFFAAHVPDFGRGEMTFPEIGDRLENGQNVEHLTLNYWYGHYTKAVRAALRGVCSNVASFEVRTDGVTLVGENKDIPAQSIEDNTYGMLMGLHAALASAVERACPDVRLSLSWAMHKYNPHITFQKRDGLWVGEVEDRPFEIGGITIWQREEGGPYEVVDKIRLKGRAHE